MFNGNQAEAKTVMESAYEGPLCSVCGYPAPDKSRWARLGLIGLWRFGTPHVPLCVVCSQFAVNLIRIKDIVVGSLRDKGIHIGVPAPDGSGDASAQPTERKSADPDLGRPPGMPQGAD